MPLTKAGLARKKRFEELRTNIYEQTKDVPVMDAIPIPILHNEAVIYLQFSGWSINLYPDGHYWVQTTEGG